MLTPVDIQQKRFHVGLGYDKKDVNAFFEEVSRSYEELYRSNADLKDRVITLTEGLQNYKSKEAALEKSLMLAEKDSEDTKSRANKEAKTIKSEAKAKAQAILLEAENRLEQIKSEIALLETQYAAYKTNFCNLMKRQFDFLKVEDFDVDAYIDEKALGVLVSAGGGYAPANNSSASFSYTGDPQMRDESTLGGMSGGTSSMSREELNSTSAVYTSNLGANENFVDPFNPTNKGTGRYNPYDSLNPKKDQTNGEKPSGDGEKKTSFTVNTGKGRARRNPIPTATKNEKQDSTYTKTEEEKKSYSNPFSTQESKSEPKTSYKDEEDVIPTVDINDKDSAEVVPDVGETINGRALLGEEDTTSETADEFGFEFV